MSMQRSVPPHLNFHLHLRLTPGARQAPPWPLIKRLAQHRRPLNLGARSPSAHRTLQIYSRTPNPGPEFISEKKAVLAALGYPADEIRDTPQVSRL